MTMCEIRQNGLSLFFVHVIRCDCIYIISEYMIRVTAHGTVGIYYSEKFSRTFLQSCLFRKGEWILLCWSVTYSVHTKAFSLQGLKM